MRTLLSCVALACLALPAATVADVYRWVDDNGVVHFGDRPGDERAERLHVRSGQPSAPTPLASIDDEADDEGTGITDDTPTEVGVAPSEDEVAEARRENCEQASARLERLERAPRLYREGPDGERLYLEEEDLETVLAQARADVDEWCD